MDPICQELNSRRDKIILDAGNSGTYFSGMEKLNVQQLVAALGGRGAVADLCKISAGAVQKWESSNEVPPKHWPRIVKTTNNGVTYDMLANAMEGERT